MSLTTYKLPITQEGSKSFFSKNPASNWDFMNYIIETHNNVNKLKKYNQIVNDYSNDLHWIERQESVPRYVKEHAITLRTSNKPAKAMFSRTIIKKDVKNYNILVSGNNNNITNNFGDTNNESSSSTSPIVPAKRNATEADADVSTRRRKKEEDLSESIWKDWVMFLQDENNNSSFHPYSPENHGIIRCGKHVSNKPNLDGKLYNQHLEIHKESSYPLPSECIDYISLVIDSTSVQEFKTAFRNNINSNSVFEFLEDIFRASYDIYTSYKNLEDYENTFNEMLVFPFVKAASKTVDRNVSDCCAEFSTGEVCLQAMKSQLKNIPLYNDSKNQYKADGTLVLYGIDKLEILLLETSSHFGNNDQHKISFDHHKALFGAVAMLKTIADQFPLAAMDLFEKTKVFFLHAAEKRLLLWSLRFVPERPLYELWLERSLDIKPEFQKRAEFLSELISFFWSLVGFLGETSESIKLLRDDHTKKLISVRFKNNVSLPSLLDYINPSILRLSEEDDKSGMGKLGPFFI